MSRVEDFGDLTLYLPFTTGRKRPILLKKSEFQVGRHRGWLSQQNLFTTLSGFSVRRATSPAAYRLVWVGASGGKAFLNTPLAISMVADTCAFREPVIAALERYDRQWKVLFENGNLETTVAVVSSDLAVSAWLKSAVPPGLEILPAEAQPPDLQPFAISLLRSKGTASTASVELVRHIHEHLDRS